LFATAQKYGTSGAPLRITWWNDFTSFPSRRFYTAEIQTTGEISQ
jgi:hypothetical protein